MRRERISISLATVAAAAAVLIAAAPAGASQPGDTEHGVNRAKLAGKAERVVETRNGIEVLKISRCGPRKRKGKLDFSTWVCMWRAEGAYAGDVPYHCSGKAVWKRKRNRWRVDKCENRLQPMAPLLDVPNPPATFGFNDNWIFASQNALDLLGRARAQVARVSLPWAGVEPTRGNFNWHGTDVLYDELLARGVRPLWVLMDAPCFAQSNTGRLRERARQRPPLPRQPRRARGLRGHAPPGATRTRSRSRSGTSPTTRGSGAGRPSPASTPRC